MTEPERSDAELIAVCVEIGLPSPDVDTDTDGETNFYFKDGDRAALATRTSNGRLKVFFETGVERWRATYSIDSAVWRWHLAKFFGQDEQLIASQAAEIARLRDGLSAIVHCQSPVSRAAIREGCLQILNGKTSRKMDDQSPFVLAAYEAASRMRERAAQVADEYAAPNRFSVSDSWREQTPAEVYETAAIDVANWIATAIAALPLGEK